MQNQPVSSITQTGLKYWLAPGGTLYIVTEHQKGALDWGWANLDRLGLDQLSPLFGVREMQQLGWLRLVTTAEKILVDGLPGRNATLEQHQTLLQLRRRYQEISGKETELLAGDNPMAPDLKKFI